MIWSESIVATLKRHEVRLITYLPDTIVHRVLALIEQDPYFERVPLAREEEGIGILTGAYLGGKRGALFAQNSGLGNSANALASLAVPWQVPFLMFWGQRGELGEFNLSQVGTPDLPGIVFVSPYAKGSAEEAPIDWANAVGDINGDGFGDIQLGVSEADYVNPLEPSQRRNKSGEMYLIYGSNAGSNTITVP